MRNNFRDWPKDKLRIIAAMGGKATKGISKSFPNRKKWTPARRASYILSKLGKD